MPPITASRAAATPYVLIPVFLFFAFHISLFLMPPDRPTPHRLLIVLPSWVGDCVMATPTLRLIRDSFRGAFIGGLMRPGLDELLGGAGFFDEVHVERAGGVMGPKFAAAKVRPRRYDTAILFPNSFSTALIVRIAGIPRRIGYSRDSRGLLLTESIRPPKTAKGDWAIVPAVDYYYTLAHRLLLPGGDASSEAPLALPTGQFMELATTPDEERAGAEILAKGGVREGERLVMLNPGANKDWKRWPGDRYAALAKHVREHFGATVLLNGSPAENELIDSIAAQAGCPVVALPRLGIRIGSLKAIVRRCSLMVTNDTGPRHIAAAFGVPLVTIYGPTDHRWAPIPTRPNALEVKLLADPTLPEAESANDHPERCAIGKVTFEAVRETVDRLLTTPAGPNAGVAQAEGR